MSEIVGPFNEETGKVIVAIDKDKGSQYALKWVVENVLSRGETVTLLHVNPRSASLPNPRGKEVSYSGVHEEVARAFKEHIDNQAKEIFLPFRCFCTRKDIKTEEIVLDSNDTAKAIIEFANFTKAKSIVLGGTSRSSLIRRFKGPDVPTLVLKGGVSDSTSVYVIGKGKIVSIRNASRQPQACSPRRDSGRSVHGRFSEQIRSMNDDTEMIKSPFSRCGAANGRQYGEIPVTPPESDISFVSSDRPSIDRQAGPNRYMFPGFIVPQEGFDFGVSPRISGASESDRVSFGGSSAYSGYRFLDMTPGGGMAIDSSSESSSEDVESQVWRLRQELKQTMEMYNAACKEAVYAKKKAKELEALKMEEDRRLQQARLAEETAMTVAEKEKQKTKAAQKEVAEAAQKVAQMEAQKRMIAETKASHYNTATSGTLTNNNFLYRRYTIEEIEVATDYFSEFRLIGSGGYGAVYKSKLDHTQVAIKVLRPDAEAQGNKIQLQFQREVEILSCIRHPNMVILLGACPEFGCLVYEYMSNGSLEDRLFCRGNTPPIPWQIRFRIAAEIGTSLHFLHQTKPEPLVHRDLKPANILLDRNYVSKISDVGLARLVPPSVANSVTQYRMTQAAGTFCYIDPEYQQTGMLGTKSDVYSLGILFLQLITAKPPMGLLHHVRMAVENGELNKVLDPGVQDWAMPETLEFAEMALKCAELRRKDRPDLGKVILPLLERLRDMADDNINMTGFFFHNSNRSISSKK